MCDDKQKGLTMMMPLVYCVCKWRVNNNKWTLASVHLTWHFAFELGVPNLMRVDKSNKSNSKDRLHWLDWVSWIKYDNPDECGPMIRARWKAVENP